MASLFQMQGATGSGGDPVVIVTSLYFCLNLFFSFRSVFFVHVCKVTTRQVADAPRFSRGKFFVLIVS